MGEGVARQGGVAHHSKKSPKKMMTWWRCGMTLVHSSQSIGEVDLVRVRVRLGLGTVARKARVRVRARVLWRKRLGLGLGLRSGRPRHCGAIG